MNFKYFFRHLVLLEMISFDKIFKQVAQTFAIRCKKISLQSFCPLDNRTSVGLPFDRVSHAARNIKSTGKTSLKPH